ncbi:hypothetical protein PRZ48_007879 [Zasmidium cellare]|uniref:Cytochrome P450 n=1 Tax=Zasmidium cellare TaxID=395010 RepID=A0ABR0ELI4_ZASCE|nr:hypothetical protein PRZ48_007879 [Zasmidium cellare]
MASEQRTLVFNVFSSHPVLAAVVLILTVLLAPTSYKGFSGPTSTLPGTFISRWTDLSVRVRTLLGTRAQYVHRLHSTYGPVVRLGPNDVDISDVDAAREIHRVRDPFLTSEFYGVGLRVTSLFSTRDPHFHAQRRRLIGPYFTEASLTAFEDKVSGLVQATVDGIVKEARKTGCADILKWWTLMAMDVIADLTFGESFGMVEKGEKTQFADDVGMLGSILPLRTAFTIIFALGPYLPFVPFFHNIAVARERVFTVQQKRYARFMELVQADDGAKSKSIFGALVKKSGESELTPMDLIVEAQSFITAGTDTTAVTLTYLIWAVCRDEEIKLRLLRELESLPAGFKSSDVKALPYLNNVIGEALRCYGAAPGSLPRVVPPAGATLAGHTIPGDAIVSTQSYSLHRDESIFADPEKYISSFMHAGCCFADCG